MAKAVTDIVRGKKLKEAVDRGPGARGLKRTHENTTIEAGNTVKKGDFSDDEWKQLLAAGAVVENDDDFPPARVGEATAGGPVAPTQEQLDAEFEALKAANPEGSQNTNQGGDIAENEQKAAEAEARGEQTPDQKAASEKAKG
jgi:hypothetical protein